MTTLHGTINFNQNKQKVYSNNDHTFFLKDTNGDNKLDTITRLDNSKHTSETVKSLGLNFETEPKNAQEAEKLFSESKNRNAQVSSALSKLEGSVRGALNNAPTQVTEQPKPASKSYYDQAWDWIKSWF